jgi:tetratricopeptide (TPR) repeat protein
MLRRWPLDSHARLTRCGAALVGGVLVFWLQACASGPPPTPTALGEAALAEGDWRSARRHFGEALKLDSHNGRAWVGQARAQLAGREPEAALQSFSRLARVDGDRFRGEALPDYADALEAAAQTRLASRKSEAALVAVRALAQLEPDRRGLDRLLGRALVAEAERRRLLGERGPALSLYREACRVAPQELDAWVAAVEILLEQRKRKQAMQLLEAARKAHPTAGSIRTLTLQAMKIR